MPLGLGSLCRAAAEAAHAAASSDLPTFALSAPVRAPSRLPFGEAVAGPGQLQLGSRGSRTPTLLSSFTKDEGEDEDAGETPAIDEAVAEAEKALKAAETAQVQISQSHANVMDAQDQLSISEARTHIDRAVQFVNGTMQETESLDNLLRQLDVVRTSLYRDLKVGPKLGQPFQERADLQQMGYLSDQINQLIASAVAPTNAAIRQLQALSASMEAANPALVIEDAQLKSAIEGVENEPPAVTAAGCLCDPMSTCAKQGQPFTWCIVSDTGTCNIPTMQDPSGTPHLMVDDPSKMGHATSPAVDLPAGMAPPGAAPSASYERLHEKLPGKETFHWDYCVPPAAQAEEAALHPGATKTAHVNCRCAPRFDILDRYLHDEDVLDSKGNPDLLAIPFSDRVTVESMMLHKGNPSAPLCSAVSSSKGFAVCPVSADCQGLKRMGDGYMARDGLNPSSSWFSGTTGRSWDFCVPAEPTQEQVMTHKKNVETRKAEIDERNGVKSEALPTPVPTAAPVVEGQPPVGGTEVPPPLTGIPSPPAGGVGGGPTALAAAPLVPFAPPSLGRGRKTRNSKPQRRAFHDFFPSVQGVTSRHTVDSQSL